MKFASVGEKEAGAIMCSGFLSITGCQDESRFVPCQGMDQAVISRRKPKAESQVWEVRTVYGNNEHQGTIREALTVTVVIK